MFTFWNELALHIAQIICIQTFTSSLHLIQLEIVLSCPDGPYLDKMCVQLKSLYVIEFVHV